MSIAWIVTTDGRGEFLERTLPSWEQAEGDFVAKYILDDSGDSTYRTWLQHTFGKHWQIVPNGMSRQGYTAAMRRVRELGLHTGADYILHLEDDFILNAPFDFNDVTRVLDVNTHLAQIALLRQPWYTNEVEHGGVIQALQVDGQPFDEKTNGEHHWIEHRAVWTNNPNVFSREVARMTWPDGAYSEASFMRSLRETTSLRCAYWGRLSDEPRVTHIGDYKMGTGY